MRRQKEIFLEKLAFHIRHVLLRQALAQCPGTLVVVVSIFGVLLQAAERIR